MNMTSFLFKKKIYFLCFQNILLKKIIVKLKKLKFFMNMTSFLFKKKI